MLLLSLAPVRRVEVQVDDCGSGAVSQTGSRRPEPTVSSQSQIRLKVSLVVHMGKNVSMVASRVPEAYGTWYPAAPARS